LAAVLGEDDAPVGIETGVLEIVAHSMPAAAII
jgi:hypothetical protein